MNTLVVYCHPNPESFIAAARDVVVDALRADGDDVRLTDLYAEGFEPVFSADEHEHHLDIGGHPDVERHVADLQWCERLVLVYPTWWSGQPAMLKGWIDRVWVRGAVWELPTEGKRIEGRLRDLRRLVVVTTHGSPKWVNALQGEPGKRVVSRTLRAVCHPLARTRWIALYGLDRASDADRAAFLRSLPRRVTRR
ncbi:MAG: NAD(P)H-dependent oxidoreductase [Desertimonas sp.]